MVSLTSTVKRLAVFLLLLLVAVHAIPVAAQTGGLLTAREVVSALQAAGLPVNNLHKEPLYGTPSGPPMTEKEAWRFSIPEVAPSGGKIMIFANDVRRDHKASWFRKVHADVLVYKNVILWLDKGLKGARVAAYRKVLKGL